MRSNAAFIVVLVLVLFECAAPNYAYLTSTIEDNQELTHETIIKQTLQRFRQIYGELGTNDVVNADDGSSISITKRALDDMVSLLEDHESDLIHGVRDAEYSGGMVTFRKQRLSRNYFSHFYNPGTMEGYRSSVHDAGVQRFAESGLLGAAFTQALGPALGSDKVADWYYARAIHAMRSNATKQAMHDLGYCLHLLQDATMPHHATDCGAENKECRYQDYEEIVDVWRSLWQHNYNSDMATLLSLSTMTPAQLIDHASTKSSPKLESAKQTSTQKDIIQELLHLSMDVSAALCLRFFRNWRVEAPFDVVVFRIDRVSLVGGWPNERSQADFRPFVSFGTEEGATAGYVANKNTFKPQHMVDSHAWMFVHRLTTSELSAGSIQVHIEVHDVESQGCGDNCGKISQRMIIAPDGADKHTFTFAFDSQNFTKGNSSGCADVTSCPDYAIEVDYSIGLSYWIQGVRWDVGLEVDANLFEMQIGGIPLWYFITGATLLCLFFVAYSVYLCKKRAKKKASKKPKQTYQPGAGPGGIAWTQEILVPNGPSIMMPGTVKGMAPMKASPMLAGASAITMVPVQRPSMMDAARPGQ